MTRATLLPMIGLLTLLIAPPGRAQLVPGAPLRIVADSIYQGTLLRAQGAQLVLVREPERDTIVVPLTLVRAVAVQSPRRTTLREGALVGAFLGMVSGGYIAARSYAGQCPHESLACVNVVGAEARTIEGVGMGGLAGAMAGGVIGALFHTGGGWRQLSIAPQHSGLGVRFTF